jgi:copper(I)-binding protein
VSRPEIRTVRPRPVRAAFAIGAAAIGAVVLAGCGAGQITQTDTQVAAVGGANATVGDIAVRNAEFEYDSSAVGADIYPPGGSAPIQMSIVNFGSDTDRLLAASSPAATSVQISGPTDVPGGQVLVVEGEPPAALPPAPPAPAGDAGPMADATPAPEQGPEATATPQAAAEPAATPTEAAPAEPPTIVPGAPAEGEPAAPAGTTVVLTGLHEALQVGPTYQVVLTFERAGAVPIDVPVGNPNTPRQESHAE